MAHVPHEDPGEFGRSESSSDHVDLRECNAASFDRLTERQHIDIIRVGIHSFTVTKKDMMIISKQLIEVAKDAILAQWKDMRICP
jgi:hypothetical protein